MNRYFLAVALLFIFFSFSKLKAQYQCPIKFGKIAISDFDFSKSTNDSSHNAIVVADVGSSVFEGNARGWFSLIFTRKQRIQILNNNGLDAANISIPYYVASISSNGEEKIDNIKAITYNLENGIIQETKLESNQIFKDKVSKNWFVSKFTMPSVKPGSIIEITYTIKSEFLQYLRDWKFQSKYPHLWSEYQVEIPSYFNYLFYSQGIKNFHQSTKKTEYRTYLITNDYGAGGTDFDRIGTNVNVAKWVMKDIPPIKNETYISTPENHLTKIEFQLQSISLPNTAPREIIGNWLTVADKMIKDEDFGLTLSKPNNWLDDDLKKLLGNSADPLEKAKKIYYQVQNNFTSTGQGYIYLTEPLKTIYGKKKGTCTDLNLLLAAMLKHEKIEAYPLILSTTNNGKTNELYPLMDKYNYVVIACKINEHTYYLDASEPLIGFGRLPEKCYNGQARIIDVMPKAIDLSADSVKETKQTSVFLGHNNKGEIEGSFTSNMGYFESLDLRNKIKKTSIEAYTKEIKSAFGTDYDITDLTLDSLSLNEEPIIKKFNFSLPNSNQDIIYFNPVFSDEYKENPFSVSTRMFPVEMPYLFDEIYLLNYTVPENYEVDDLPKSAKVAMQDGSAYFEYLVQKSGETVKLRSRIYIKKATFSADEYEELREFFGYVVKKHAEQIVLKKIKK